MSNPITQNEIAEQFISQYHAFNSNSMEGTVFTDEQMGGMIRAIKSEPEAMCLFFTNVGEIIGGTIFENTGGDWKEVHTAYAHYNSVITSLLVRVLSVLAEGDKRTYKSEMVRTKYTNDHDTLFANLDFNLPDWDDLAE